MSYSMSLNMNHKQAQSLKQSQRLIMSPQMQQAIHLLQLPVMELAAAVAVEMENNPVLEYPENYETVRSDLEMEVERGDNESSVQDHEVQFDDQTFEVMKHLNEEYRDHFSQSEGYRGPSTAEDEKYQAFLESSIRQESSLFEHLYNQACEVMDNPEDLAKAEVILGNLDERGFLEMSLDEIALFHQVEREGLEDILTVIQTFDPYGVGAANLRESLLIQLRCQGKKPTLAYAIVEEHYEDLLNNRIPVIQKSLGCTAQEITDAVDKHISKLDLNPGVWHLSHQVQVITPDVAIVEENGALSVRLDQDKVPRFRISPRYLRMLEDESLPLETKEYIRNKILSGKWLLKNIDQRNSTIYRIAEYLIQTQEEYLKYPQGQLKPLTMKAVAEHLELHESTVARAVNSKYVDCSRGILPLRSFFTNGYADEKGSAISSNTVKDLVRDIIADENKAKPLSDDAISKMIKDKGIKCARRTVAKYRKELNLGNASQRRQYT